MRTPPICSMPVGLGAKRVRMDMDDNWWPTALNRRACYWLRSESPSAACPDAANQCRKPAVSYPHVMDRAIVLQQDARCPIRQGARRPTAAADMRRNRKISAATAYGSTVCCRDPVRVLVWLIGLSMANTQPLSLLAKLCEGDDGPTRAAEAFRLRLSGPRLIFPLRWPGACKPMATGAALRDRDRIEYALH